MAGPVVTAAPDAGQDDLRAATFDGDGLYGLPGAAELLLSGGLWTGGIEAVWPPRLHDNLSFTIGRFGGWLVQVLASFYDDRLVLTPETDPDAGYDYAWTYPRGGAAVLAVATWDPGVQGEPAGYVSNPLGPTRVRAAGDVWKKP